MNDKIQVIRLEDAVKVARGLLRDFEYGYSIDDLVVEAEGFMKSYSFEIEDIENELWWINKKNNRYS